MAATKKSPKRKRTTRPQRPNSNGIATHDRALFPEDMVTSIRRRKRPITKGS